MFILKVLKCHCFRCSNKDKDLIQLKDFISSSSCSTSSTSSYLWLVWLALGLAALAACVFALFKYKSNRLFLCFSLMQDHDEYLFTGLVFWKGKSLSGRLAGTKLLAKLDKKGSKLLQWGQIDVPLS